MSAVRVSRMLSSRLTNHGPIVSSASRRVKEEVMASRGGVNLLLLERADPKSLTYSSLFALIAS